MSTLSSISLIACIVNISIALLILFSNARSRLNRVYLLWSFAVFTWNAASVPLYSDIPVHTAYLWMLVLQAGVFFLPASLLHVSIITVDARKQEKLMPFVYGLTGIFGLLLMQGQMISGVKKLEAGYWAVANWGYYLFIIFFLLVTIGAMLILYKSQKKASLLNRRRIIALLIAIAGLWVFGTNDLLPIFGIENYPILNHQFIPIGNAASIGYAFIIGYSVVQHQLLDVKIGISRFAATSIRIALHATVGVFILSIALIVLPKVVTGNIVMLTVLVITLTGATSSLLFPRILGRGNETLERRLLGDKFSYQEKLSDFISSIPLVSDTKLLFEDLEVLLTKIVGLNEYRIVLLDEITKQLFFFQSYPPLKESSVKGLSVDCHIFSLIEELQEDFISIQNLEPDSKRKFKAEIESSLASPEAQFCFVLKSDATPYGFLLLSGKSNGEPFTQNDLDLLNLLVRNLGLVINQMRLKDKIRIEQEMDLLGRMSKGLAHDLNNLLTPVWTLLQVTASSPANDPEIELLIDSATQNVSAMRNYIRDSLFFSKTMKPQMSEARIEDLVGASIGILSSRAREREVSLQIDVKHTVVSVLDVVLFQRLLSNLISNALDASAPGSVISIEVQSAKRRDRDQDWLQLKVIDHGEGISPENLEKMKAAFFTTKDSGDGKRGFGLGLAICRKIVHLHGGTLNVSSQLGKGTTVQVDLPNGSMPVLIAAESLEGALSV